MDPITLTIIAAVGAAFGALITYFLVSSSGKERARQYKSKVLLILTKLKERIERLERQVEELRRAKEQAEARARQAEAEHGETNEQADVWRGRARRAEGAMASLEVGLARLRGELARWEKEALQAEKLVTISGMGLSLGAAFGLVDVVRASAVLNEHRIRPSRALEELDLECAEIDAMALAAEAEARSTLALFSALSDETVGESE